MTSLPPMTVGAAVWDWSRPYLLGIVNVTPDSFSRGGRHRDPSAALFHGLALVDEGADALDIGGESTRPGSAPVSLQEELDRVIPVLEGLRARTAVPLSIDTTKAAVAEAALRAGASIVNDVMLGDPPEAMGAVAAVHGAVYLAMHARGTPATMRSLATYDAPVEAVVSAELRAVVDRLCAVGVDARRIVLDPGIGFAKTGAQSLRLLSRLEVLRAMGYPLCVGASRKSFIVSEEAHLGVWPRDVSEADARIGGTAATVTAAVLAGAEIVRVHDVRVMAQAARVAHALRAARDA